MTAAPLNDPVWVSRPVELHKMCADLSRHRQIGVDSESNGLYAYQEQVCLIQFSTGEQDYLVDPLALTDLSELGLIFENPAIEKIFHAAEYDILCLKRDFGFHFANLFDTMLAARILGRKEIGLGSILALEFNLELDKRHQRANWGRRPLTESMLAYARLDSHYLIDLRDRLYAELEQKQLLPLAREDFERMCQTPPAPLEVQADTCWSIATPKEVGPHEAAVLQALCEYRDRQARFANQPTFRILPNHALIHIAQACPHSQQELAEISSLPGHAVERFGKGLLAAVEKGLASPPLYPPHNHRPPEAQLHRLQLLRDWRKETGRELGVESDVILPKDVLSEIAEKHPRTSQDLAAIMAGLPYRLDRFGPDILRVLARKGAKIP